MNHNDEDDPNKYQTRGNQNPERGTIHTHRVPFFVARWAWQVELGDWHSIGGWAMTKRGAIRQAREAAIARSVRPLR